MALDAHPREQRLAVAILPHRPHVGGHQHLHEVAGFVIAGLAGDLDFVDQLLGRMVSELRKNGLLDQTLIIVTAKHGQSPIDIQKRTAINDGLPASTVGSSYAFDISDDASLIWLKDPSFTAGVVANLSTPANQAALGIQEIFALQSMANKFNSPLHVKHVQNLLDMQKAGLFKYGGRDSAGDALFASGECAIIHDSSGLRGRLIKEAKFAWAAAPLPYWPDVKDAPKNSILGGASFWVLKSPSRKPDDYKGIAAFFNYINKPEIAAKWSMDTGYVPVTMAAFEIIKKGGYYEKNPGADVAYLQMTRTEPTDNSKGLRLGNMPEIRNIMQEELEKAFQGQQDAKQALDNAVTRGNVVLRNFERTNKS